jgi:hypothetical protein
MEFRILRIFIEEKKNLAVRFSTLLKDSWSADSPKFSNQSLFHFRNLGTLNITLNIFQMLLMSHDLNHRGNMFILFWKLNFPLFIRRKNFNEDLKYVFASNLSTALPEVTILSAFLRFHRPVRPSIGHSLHWRRSILSYAARGLRSSGETHKRAHQTEKRIRQDAGNTPVYQYVISVTVHLDDSLAHLQNGKKTHCFIKHHVMETNGEVEEYLHTFLTLAIGRDMNVNHECYPSIKEGGGGLH